MRIGGSNGAASSQRAGMSALWHDPDYNPVKKLETPLVTRGLEEMALPSEEHALPEGHTDPFAKQDAIYDIAAQDMERGLKGLAFLNGNSKGSSNSTSPALKSNIDLARDAERISQPHFTVDKNAPAHTHQTDDFKATQLQLDKRDQTSSTPISHSSNKTANEGMDAAVKSIEMAQGMGLGLVAAVAPGIDPSSAAAAATAGVKAAVLAKNAVDIASNIDKQYDAHSKLRDNANRSTRPTPPIFDDDEW